MSGRYTPLNQGFPVPRHPLPDAVPWSRKDRVPRTHTQSRRGLQKLSQSLCESREDRKEEGALTMPTVEVKVIKEPNPDRKYTPGINVSSQRRPGGSRGSAAISKRCIGFSLSLFFQLLALFTALRKGRSRYARGWLLSSRFGVTVDARSVNLAGLRPGLISARCGRRVSRSSCLEEQPQYQLRATSQWFDNYIFESRVRGPCGGFIQHVVLVC